MIDLDNDPVEFLVVDDAKPIHSLMRVILRNQGYTNFYFAETGEEALKVIRNQDPKCIICDWHMPQMNGIELLHILRNDPSTFTVPFVMLTAESAPAALMQAVEEGIDGYVVKPFKPISLQNAISLAMTKKFRQNRFQRKVVDLTRLKLEKKYAEALELGTELLNVKQDPDVMLIVGECLNALHRRVEAIAFMQKGGLENRRSKAKSLLGRIYLEQGNVEQAIQYMREAVDASPLCFERKVDLVNMYLAAGLSHEAELLTDEIMRSNPTNLNKIELGHSLLTHGDLEKAGVYFGGDTVPTADTVQYFNEYAMQLRKRQRYAESEAIYKRCINVSPECFALHYNLGILYELMNRPDPACRAMIKALRLCPDHQSAQAHLAKLSSRIGQTAVLKETPQFEEN